MAWNRLCLSQMVVSAQKKKRTGMNQGREVGEHVSRTQHLRKSRKGSRTTPSLTSPFCSAPRNFYKLSWERSHYERSDQRWAQKMPEAKIRKPGPSDRGQKPRNRTVVYNMCSCSVADRRILCWPTRRAKVARDARKLEASHITLKLD